MGLKNFLHLLPGGVIATDTLRGIDAVKQEVGDFKGESIAQDVAGILHYCKRQHPDEHNGQGKYPESLKTFQRVINDFVFMWKKTLINKSFQHAVPICHELDTCVGLGSILLDLDSEVRIPPLSSWPLFRDSSG